MDDFLKMDIFFAVTTAVVLGGGALCLIALFYIIKILRSVDNIAENVSEESNDLRGDIKVLRQKVREEGMKVKHFTDFFGGFMGRRTSRVRHQKPN